MKMTRSEHPLTPPPELVQQWYNECPEANEASLLYIATQAARWGADQELEACCLWLGAGRRENLSQVIALRAALDQPEPEGPTQRQLLQLAAEFWPVNGEPTQAIPFARAVLARWGRPTPQSSTIEEVP
jgi:hypothetical protein